MDGYILLLKQEKYKAKQSVNSFFLGSILFLSVYYFTIKLDVPFRRSVLIDYLGKDVDDNKVTELFFQRVYSG